MTNVWNRSEHPAPHVPQPSSQPRPRISPNFINVEDESEASWGTFTTFDIPLDQENLLSNGFQLHDQSWNNSPLIGDSDTIDLDRDRMQSYTNSHSGFHRQNESPADISMPSGLPTSVGFDSIDFAGRRSSNRFTPRPARSDKPQMNCIFGIMTKSQNELKFTSTKLSESKPRELQEQLVSTAIRSADGLILLVITDWNQSYREHLQNAVPSFPVEMTLHLNESRATTMLPLIDNEVGEFYYVMEHINTNVQYGRIGSSRADFKVGQVKAQTLPLVVFSFAKGCISGDSTSRLIVVISRNDSTVSSLIASHFQQGNNERWYRLHENNNWVYLDLYFLFTRWDRIWSAVKQNLNDTIEKVHKRKRPGSILELTKQLHIENNMMISLREHLRIHKTSLGIVRQRAMEDAAAKIWGDSTILKRRLDDACQLLEYYEVTATGLLEQQQNLLSLAFNLESAMQSQTVARLNALAFVFLPLGFVSSIFGITTFTASPKWYPVFAVPVLFTTLLVAWVASKLVNSRSLPSNLVITDEEDTSSRDLRLGSVWSKYSRKERHKKSYPTSNSEDYLLDTLNFNDPSRIKRPERKSTVQSLGHSTYCPPRSTIHMLPRARRHNLSAAHNMDAQHHIDSLPEVHKGRELTPVMFTGTSEPSSRPETRRPSESAESENIIRDPGQYRRRWSSVSPPLALRDATSGSDIDNEHDRTYMSGGTESKASDPVKRAITAGRFGPVSEVPRQIHHGTT